MVQANTKKLESIEKFLENLDCKIEILLASDLVLTKTKKRKADVVREISPKDRFRWVRVCVYEMIV